MRLTGLAARAFGEMSETVLVTMLGLVADATLTRVSRTSALGRYERAGYNIEDVREIGALNVSVPDRVVRSACRRWIALAGTTGVATSATGAVGLAADIPTLLANNLMAVGEIASIYGFDVSDEDEHARAIALLFVQHRDRTGRSNPASYLNEIARELQEGTSWREIRDEKAGRWLRQAARELVWYLIKRKFAGIIPGIGAVVAGGVNAQFTARTCAVAREYYRNRFLSGSVS